MSWTKNYNRIICDSCGKFCNPYDEETPYGCADPEDPEPYDPTHFCKKCAKDYEKEWDEKFKKAIEDKRVKGIGSYTWQKSNAEMKAAKKYGYVYLHTGIGILSTKRWLDSYQYITKNRYKYYSNLPYWGWCSACGKIRKNGYCSNRKCEKSFKNQMREKGYPI